MIDIDGNDMDKKPKAKRAPSVKKPVVSADECKKAAVAARSKLLTLQKDLTELIKGLEDVAKGDANFFTRDAITAMLKNIGDASPQTVLKELATVHSARLIARAKE